MHFMTYRDVYITYLCCEYIHEYSIINNGNANNI